MKQKKGQFFLVAAIVIVVVVISLVTVSNYIERTDSVKLYDLGAEMKIESQHVLDAGTYDGRSEEEMKQLMEDFIENYVNYTQGGKNLYFVFGNKDKINIKAYQELAEESACIKLDAANPNCTPLKVEETQSFIPTTDIVIIQLTENENINEYQFLLTTGQNFYFVIWQETEGGEKYVITSEE